MLQIAIERYYTFFDETISSSTFIVLMITCLIFAAWTISPSVSAQGYKWDITQAISQSQSQSKVIIDGVEYQVQFTKVVSR